MDPLASFCQGVQSRTTSAVRFIQCFRSVAGGLASLGRWWLSDVTHGLDVFGHDTHTHNLISRPHPSWGLVVRDTPTHTPVLVSPFSFILFGHKIKWDISEKRCIAPWSIYICTWLYRKYRWSYDEHRYLRWMLTALEGFPSPSLRCVWVYQDF